MNQLVKFDLTAADMIQVKMTFFGAVRALKVSGTEAKMPRMALALAALLLLDKPTGGISREAAARFLWSELDAKRAAGNLRQLLMRIRSIEMAHRICLFDTSGEAININIKSVDADILMFRTAIASNSTDRITQICELYCGDFFEGFVGNSDKLTDWLRARRALLREEFANALLPWLDDETSFENLDALKAAARRLLKLEPYSEAGYRAMFRVHAARGERVALNRTYQKLKRLLHSDLHTKPSQQSNEVYRALSRKVISTQRDSQTPQSFVRKTNIAGADRVRWNLASDTFAAITNGVAVPAANIRATAQVAPVAVNRKAAPRVAIVPRVMLGICDADTQLFNCIIDDLTFQIWQMRALQVALPHAREVGGKSTDSQNIDYHLGVHLNHTVSTPVVHVQLLANSTHELLWGNRFDSFTEFSRRLPSTVMSIIGCIEDCEVRFGSTVTPRISAYRATTEGQKFLQCIDLPMIRRGRNSFKKALVISPGHIPALAGISRSYVLEWLLRMNPEPSLLLAAEDYSKRMTVSAPEDHRGFQELGVVQMYLRKFDDCVETLKHAQVLGSADPDVSVDLADAFVADGRATEAIDQFARSKQLLQRGVDGDHWIAAGAHYFLENYNSAIQEISKMRNQSTAFRILAASYAMLGDRRSANRVVRDTLEFNPEFELSRWLAMIPTCNGDYLRHFTDGLRKAGFS
jgi:DNA-binding SARP family transcriptional activator/tetratricopeptide (TPR) repeat protein